MESKVEILKKANLVLNDLRPFLEADGGDMEILDINSDGILIVRLIGACSSCSMSAMTLNSGLFESIQKLCPEVKGIEAVKDIEVV